MRKLLLLGLLALAGLGRAEDFTAIMTPEDRAATGIDRLTPDELARLKAVVERYKGGEVAVVRQEAAVQVATVKQEAEQKVSAAEQKASLAEQKVQAAEQKVQVAETKAAVAPKKQPGWLGALITLKKAEEKPDAAEVMESRLEGSLTNFRGQRKFTLANGQVWQMTEGGSYAGPKLDAPVVTVRPGFMGTFWLNIQAAPLYVRVKPVKLE